MLPSSAMDVDDRRYHRGKKNYDRRLLLIIGSLVILMTMVTVTLRWNSSSKLSSRQRHRRRATVTRDDDNVHDDDDDDEGDDSLTRGRAPFARSHRHHHKEHPQRKAEPKPPTPPKQAQQSKKTPPAKQAAPMKQPPATAQTPGGKRPPPAKQATPVKPKMPQGNAANPKESNDANQQKQSKEPAKKMPPKGPSWRTDAFKEMQKRRIDEVTARVKADRERRTESAAPEVSLLDEHHHVLAYYLRARRDGRLKSGATVLHIDSHADMGVPDPYPEESLPSSARVLEEYAEINDFLVLGAFVGLMDHIVFVEPPWSNQFRCCVYETNATFDFVVGLDLADRLRVDVSGPTAELFARERFGHIFWRNGERRTGDRGSLRRTSHFKVSLVALEHPKLGDVLFDLIDPAKALVVDVDLDAFATVSPGAMAIKARFDLADDELETLYHLVWNFPELGSNYLRLANPKIRDESGADVFLEKAMAAIKAAKDTPSKMNPQDSRFGIAVGRILEARGVDARRKNDIVQYASALDAAAAQRRANPLNRRPLDARANANLEAYLEQPFHVPSDPAAELDFALEHTWSNALSKLHAPLMVHIVRSPGYARLQCLCLFLFFFASVTRTHCVLSSCLTSCCPSSSAKWFVATLCRRVYVLPPQLDFVEKSYGVATVYHEARVNFKRTNCNKPYSDYIVVDDI